MKNLCIDIGNTRIKAAVFDHDNLVEVFQFNGHEAGQLQHILRKHKIDNSIVASVGKEQEEMEALLGGSTRLVQLNHDTKFPFTVEYATPQTLGMDRVAAVAGALHFFEGKNCLVIDAGTCITYDFISAEKIYSGGAISPGLQMRLKALHAFTSKLPQVDFREPEDFIGNSTESSILSGVYFGIAGEINETTARYQSRFSEVQAIICGGDAPLFVKRLKNGIFANQYLTLYGLNKILIFNV